MAHAQLHCCEGLRCQSSQILTGSKQFNALSHGQTPRARAQRTFHVVAQKRVKKTQQVVLTAQGAKAGLGAAGQITKVPNGYFRNYLQPARLALPATQGILDNILKQEQNEVQLAQQVQAKAQAMATALQTIGKFTIKKRSGDKESIFGSVTEQEVVDAIEAQTSRKLNKKLIELPDIKKLGTYEATVKLHPNVTGRFKVVVQKEKEQRHRTNKCLHAPIAQAAAVHSPQNLSELDRILCSSEPDAEAKALELINKLKEDGVVKAYGGAQQIPKRLYTLEELRLNNLRPEEFLSPEDSTLNTVRTILQAGGLAGVTAIFFAFHLTVTQALGLVVAVMFVVVGDQVGNNGGIEGLVVDTAGRYLNKTYAQRIALHEAGHFLIAYLVGLLPKVYTLSTLDAVQRYGKFNIQAGTQFCDKSFSEEIAKGQISSTSLDRYTCVALAGVSAEYLKFGRAEGGLGDVQQLDALLRAIGFTQKKTDGQIRWAVLNVTSLLRRHSRTHQKVAHAMAEGRKAHLCQRAIECEAASLSNKRRRSAGDDEGHRYLDYLWQHVSRQAVPPELDLQRLTDVIRFHGFHGSKDLSITALQMMQYLAHLHPVSESPVYTNESNQQKPVIATADLGTEINGKPWMFLDRKFHLDIRHNPDQPAEGAIIYFQKVWEHAAEQAEFLVGSRESDDFDAEDCYRNFGELCCMKLILSELQRDLRHRLAVYAKTEGTNVRVADKRNALLENSQLWRLLQNQRPYLIHSDLVLNLMRCIGPAATAEDDEEQLNLYSPAMLKKTRPISSTSDTPAGDSPSDTAANGRALMQKKQAIVSDELEWPVDAEMFSAAEISEMATLLLRMILELCGTAEEAGFFRITGKARTNMSKYDCTRIKLDGLMIDGLVGAKEVLKTVPEKATFLQSLHPRDRLRLLGMTVGSRLSISESSRYPILAEYRAILSGSKDIDGYLNVDPVSILKCVPDTTYHAAKLLHKDGSLDSLAMLTAVTVQAALALDAAEDMLQSLPKLLDFFRKQGTSGSERYFVSNNSWALLAAASYAVKAKAG
ncbi:hypothetical protein WJX82_003532 [Trebouxia sp. C0006]